jgi:hypothetical protein
MKRLCAWCGEEMGEKPGEGETHGICEKTRGRRGVLTGVLYRFPRPRFAVHARERAATSATVVFPGNLGRVGAFFLGYPMVGPQAMISGSDRTEWAS